MSEREICDHAKRLARQSDAQGVRLDHFGEVSSQFVSQNGIELHRDHASTGTGQCTSNDTAAGAEVEHEVTRPNAGRANDLRCERATAEKMLPAR